MNWIDASLLLSGFIIGLVMAIYALRRYASGQQPQQPEDLVHKITGGIDHAATGKAFRSLRIKKEISQRELAKKIGVSSTTVCQLEHGKGKWTKKRVSQFKKALLS